MSESTIEAIVLKRLDHGESDRKLVVLTKGQGKIEVIAKGARKSGSRLASISEPLTCSTLQIATGKRISYVTQAQPKRSHPGLRLDYDRLVLALGLLEVIEAIANADQENSTLFDFLDGSLAILEIHSEPKVAICWVLNALLELEGVQPNWGVCANTGAAVKENPAWFSFMAGGYVPRSNDPYPPDTLEVRAEVLLGLAALTETSRPPERLKFSAEILQLLFAVWEAASHKSLPALRTAMMHIYAGGRIG